ncbi:MAG: thiol:disulfide interchange protein DsbA/DsbL [Betaproteobacteria bacterium]
MQVRSFFRQILAVGALALATSVFAQDYTPVQPPQPTDNPAKIEVLEFFSYGCPHCSDLNAPFSAWEAKVPGDVVVRRVPVSFGRAAWANLARLYYALEATGDAGKLNAEIFKAIHAERVNLFDEKSIVEWLAKKGVNTVKFTDAFNSFSVQSKVKRGDQLSQAYRIQGVPAIAVDGKYMLEAREPKEMIAAIERTVAKARADRGKK